MKPHRFNRPWKGRKYLNTPTEFDGVRYDSKAEAAYAAELEIWKTGGSIEWILRQVPVTLGVAENRFKIDFLVRFNDGTLRFIDVKGLLKPKDRELLRLWERFGPEPIRFMKRSGKSFKAIAEAVRKSA